MMISEERAELAGLMDGIGQKYQVVSTDVAVGEHRLKFLALADEDGFLEDLVEKGEEGRIELPYWIKIWPASVVLAQAVCQVSPAARLKVLEIGAGVGVAGLFAAAMGHETTISDINPDALDFIRAEALMNNLKVKVRKLDWTAPGLEEKYDLILASEVVYRLEDHAPLLNLFKLALTERGIVLMTGMANPQMKAFFEAAAPDFTWEGKSYKLSGPDEDQRLFLFRVKRR